jgi:hypothetical protein
MREMEERERVRDEENNAREQAMREMEAKMSEMEQKMSEIKEDPAPNEVFGIDVTDKSRPRRTNTARWWSVDSRLHCKFKFIANKSQGEMIYGC